MGTSETGNNENIILQAFLMSGFAIDQALHAPIVVAQGDRIHAVTRVYNKGALFSSQGLRRSQSDRLNSDGHRARRLARGVTHHIINGPGQMNSTLTLHFQRQQWTCASSHRGWARRRIAEEDPW